MKKRCVVCDKPIEQRVGSALERCNRCNQPVCEKHWFVCVVCAGKICGNDMNKWTEDTKKNELDSLMCKKCYRYRTRIRMAEVKR